MRFIAALAVALLITTVLNAQLPEIAYRGPKDAVDVRGTEWPDVVLLTRAEGCVPCDMFLANEVKKLLRMGKSILIVPVTKGVTPSFRVFKDGVVREHQGYQTADELKVLIR